MISVTCTVTVLELDGKPVDNSAIELRSHATEIDRVLVVAAGHEYAVAAEDLIDAVVRASTADSGTTQR